MWDISELSGSVDDLRDMSVTSEEEEEEEEEESGWLSEASDDFLMNEMAVLSKEEFRRKMIIDYSGRKSLDLSKHSLHELPAALGQLTELEILDLSKNKLTTIPENIGKLNNLTALYVRGNQLSIFPTSLTQLVKLKELYISHNKLTTIPDAIGEMVELEELGLSGNQLTVLSPAIKQLKKLKELDISHNKLTTIPDAIGEMEELGLSGNQLTVLSPAIKQLKKLKELDISHNKLTTIPDAIGEMVELEELGLSGNQLTSLSPAIKQLKKLKELYISCNNLTTIPDAIGEMVELEKLGLSGNQLTSLSPAIKQLKKLKLLNISHNKLTTIPDAIWEMVELETLRLIGNQLTGLSPAMKQLKKLKWLYISDNKLTTIPDAIGEMVELETLGMSGNQLTVLSPAIKQLKKLKELHISLNNLTTIPDAIGEMVELERLGLSGNQLTVLSPAIKQLKKLKELSVFGNPFTVEGMRSVMELKDKIDRVYSDFPGIVNEETTEGRSIQLAYERALKDGYVRVNRGRIMLIGQDRAGKTSLKKSLLGLPFDPKEQSTEGIEVDPSKCEIEVDQVRNWQPTNEYKLGLLECAKDVAEIVADELVQRRSRYFGYNLGEDSKDDLVEEDSSEVETDNDTEGHLNNLYISSPSRKSKGTLLQDKMGKCFQESKHENLPNEPEVQIDASSPPGDIIKHLHQWLEYARGRVDINKETVLSLDIWDFAGQQMYYASHPIFLSSRAVYLVVHNLSKPLDALVQPLVKQGMIDVKLENSNNETNIENLLSWLATVHNVAQAPLNNGIDENSQKKLPYLRPAVFIVGTHADKPVDDIAVMKKQIQERICCKEYEKHVVRPLYCIDNTRPSSKQPDHEINAGNSCGDAIHSLQNGIMEVLRKEPYMGEKVPIRWFLFEKVIEALVAKQIFHRNLEQLEHYARKECLLKDHDEFDSMIRFYHGLGMIIKHRSTVVLKAQWLIELFKQLITIPHFDKVDPLYAYHWQELEGSGVLSMEHVNHVFSSLIGQGTIKEDILGMMEQFGLIAKFSVSPNNMKYFVPAQLKSSPEKLLKLKPSSTDPCPMYFLFMHGFVPHGLFLQLVSRSIRWCAEKWPYTHQPTLYQNGAWFIIGKDIHDFVIICKTGFIKIILRQRRQSCQVMGQNTAELATVVREFLEETLQALPQELPNRIGLQYRLCVACPYCHRDQGTEEPLKACSDCIKTTYTHKDCFHLVDANEGNPTICRRDIWDEELLICGLEKWFSRRTCQESASPSKGCSSQSPSPRENSLKQGTPTNHELQQLASQIGRKWRELGCCLGVEDELDDIEQRHKRLYERSYDMLKHWRQKEGSEATYQILNASLQQELVQRKDLAEKICYYQGHTKKRSIEDDSFPRPAKRQKTD